MRSSSNWTGPCLFPSVAALILGDVQYENGAYAKFLQSYDPTWGAGGLKAITRPAPGNHEYQTAGAAGYFDYFGSSAGERSKGYYSFDLGAWHVVALNSNCSAVGGCGRNSPQVRWLRRTSPRVRLAARSPTGTIRASVPPRTAATQPSSRSGRRSTTTGRSWCSVGHAHHYERFAPRDASARRDEPRGVREIVVGTGGKSLYSFGTVQPNSEVRSADTYGVLKLTLGTTAYEWKFVPEAGKTFTDTGTATCY